MTLGFAGLPAAEERVCRGFIGRTNVDNLRVPQDATCDLSRTRVKGTIKVENNATLRARNIVVIGNVQAENALLVVVARRSRIGGSVQVVQLLKAPIDWLVKEADALLWNELVDPSMAPMVAAIPLGVSIADVNLLVLDLVLLGEPIEHPAPDHTRHLFGIAQRVVASCGQLDKIPSTLSRALGYKFLTVSG